MIMLRVVAAGTILFFTSLAVAQDQATADSAAAPDHEHGACSSRPRQQAPLH